MKLRHLLLLSYSIVFVMMFLIMTVTYSNLTKLLNTGDWVAHTHEVIGQANLIQKLIIDMETGQRGFLITGKDSFLGPYYSGKEQYSQSIENLKKLVADNPAQTSRLTEVQDLASSWLSKAAFPEIQARQDANLDRLKTTTVQDLISKETGKQIMDQLRDKLNNFVAHEETLLVDRQTKSKNATIVTRSLVVSGTLIAITIGIMAMYHTVTTYSRLIGGDPVEIENHTRQISSGDWNSLLLSGTSHETGILASVKQMAKELKTKEEEKNTLINELQKILSEVRELRGMLPICSYCKQIRDEEGAWGKIEAYIQRNIDVEFTHGICPDCKKRHFPDLNIEVRGAQ